MIHRLVNPSTSNSFFLFGARNTGKTHFLRQFLQKQRTIDLLSEKEFLACRRSPHLLGERIREWLDTFKLEDSMRWGGLPRVVIAQNDTDRREFLESYVTTYIREEIRIEQVVRNLDPFLRFLEVAAQSSGSVVNYCAIGEPAGALRNTLDIPLRAGTSQYGTIFEQFIVLETLRLNSYLRIRAKLYYYATHDGAEIDLVVQH